MAELTPIVNSILDKQRHFQMDHAGVKSMKISMSLVTLGFLSYELAIHCGGSISPGGLLGSVFGMAIEMNESLGKDEVKILPCECMHKKKHRLYKATKQLCPCLKG